MIDTRLQAILDDLYRSGVDNDAHQEDRRRKLLNLDPDTARVIGILVRSGRRARILEIGTSNGFSTIWLAAAIRDIGGHIITVDVMAEKTAMARTNIERAGLQEWVTLVTGDATDVIGTLSGPFDCVFFDADRWSAPEQLRLLLPTLAPDVLLLHDNALSHPSEIAGYLEMVGLLSGFEHVIIPIGKGLSVAHRLVGGVTGEFPNPIT